jgi:monofunctional biosynthetic peptidoglycan transglycosylase
MERAWERNQRAQEQADKRNERALKRNPDKAIAPVSAKVVGASTITQQLAKNLFLSSERTPLRKGQELMLTYALEALLSKQRILEIYLNNVEWGEGLFGAQAASRYYFRTDAAQLGVTQAARLAVMLPHPSATKSAWARPTSPTGRPRCRRAWVRWRCRECRPDGRVGSFRGAARGRRRPRIRRGKTQSGA